jgi:hypothetical protein
MAVDKGMTGTLHCRRWERASIIRRPRIPVIRDRATRQPPGHSHVARPVPEVLAINFLFVLSEQFGGLEGTVLVYACEFAHGILGDQKGDFERVAERSSSSDNFVVDHDKHKCRLPFVCRWRIALSLKLEGSGQHWTRQTDAVLIVDHK